MLISILFYIFIVITAIQIIYYISFTTILFSNDAAVNTDKKPPVSVIICAKNEEDNLERNLASICNQDYPEFQIILINDASTDDTLDIMEHYQMQYSNIKIVNVAANERFWGNKKYALTLGIKAAKYEHLLFTDADCKTLSKNWISIMVANFSPEKTIVLGYGKYKTTNKSLLSLLIQFETLITAIQYFSFAKLGSPYMGVGRNLAYKKEEFFKVKGFIKHIQVNSGDDDLFIQQAATKENTAICLNEDSFTLSDAPTTFSEWFNQKRRHVSTSKYYKFKHQFLLGFFYLTKVIFYILAIILLVAFSWKMVLPSIFTYLVVLYVSVGLTAKKLKEQQVIWYLPFLEICLLCFQFTIFITNKFSKPVRWK